MKILLICGVYAKEYEQEVINYTKGYVEQSANIFQRKLIDGIKNYDVECKVISAPLIGAYPMRYKKSRFNGFCKGDKNHQYVKFNNIWGIRNFSRTLSLKKAIKDYLKNEADNNLLILVYCPHTPFLEAALYAKSLRSESKTCLIVPDLPQYMNLNEHGRGLYDFFKKLDIKYMNRFIAKIDSFVLLTKQMKDVLNVDSRPHIVAEGIIDSNLSAPTYYTSPDEISRIVYTGKMNIKFGIKSLVDSFMRIDNPNYKLILCGDGDAREYVESKADIDKRIEYKGMVTSSKAKEYIEMADVLVNPRPNNDTYTKYSFPSKNIEYLLSGKPVVAYMLDGMPESYNEFIYVIPNDKESYEEILIEASKNERPKKDFRSYAQKMLSVERLVRYFYKIVNEKDEESLEKI